MKRFLAILIMLVFAAPTIAQVGTFDAPVALSVPLAVGIKIVEIRIYPSDQVLRVTYRWVDADGNAIHKVGAAGRLDHEWEGRNFNALDCTAVDVPYSCCTGAGTGIGCAMWTDIFGYVIKAGNVGTVIGKGLRTLIINHMKADISELATKTITFSD